MPPEILAIIVGAAALVVGFVASQFIQARRSSSRINRAKGEADRIIRILTKCSGNKAKAARLLGIDRSTLYRKMRLYNIDPSAF